MYLLWKKMVVFYPEFDLSIINEGGSAPGSKVIATFVSVTVSKKKTFVSVTNELLPHVLV